MGLVVHNLSWKLETPEKFFKLQCLGPIARASDLIGLGSAQAEGVYHASRLRTTAAGRQEGTISVQLGNFTDRRSLSEVPGWGLALTLTWGGRLAVGVVLRVALREARPQRIGAAGWIFCHFLAPPLDKAASHLTSPKFIFSLYLAGKDLLRKEHSL